MPTVSRQVTVNAPRAAVWATLADIGSVSQWNPVVTHSVETTDTSKAGGQTGIGSARHCDLPGSMGAIDEVVTGWDELRSMEYEISGAKMMRSMQARFELEQRENSTQVTMTSDFTMILGPIGALMAATMGRRMLGQNMERTLDGLKAHVEATHDAPAESVAEDGEATRPRL